MKKLLSGILMTAMVLSLAACSGGSPQASGNTQGTQAGQSGAAEETAAAGTGEIRHDKLTVAISGEPKNIDPYGQNEQIAQVPLTVVYEPLFKTNDDGEVIPWLATEWEWEDDTTLSLTLRDDVYFHNGEKMTSEDVAFSLSRAATSSFSTALFNRIDEENFEIIDDTHIKVHLKSPNAALMPALSIHRGAIISKKAYEADPEGFARNPVGTGPMKFVQWVTGDRLEFTVNENYWGEKIAYDNLEVRFITEASSRAIELESGGVDVAMEIGNADWERIESNPNTELLTGNTLTTTFLVLNSSKEPLNDIRVREALAYGINMKGLVNTVWQGTSDVATSYYASTLLGHIDILPREYNVEKAKELLAEAGYPDGLTIKYYLYDSSVNTAVAEVLQSMWKEIGVTVDLQVSDVATFSEYDDNGEITIAHMSTTAAAPDPNPALAIWPTSRTISLRHGDKHIDELLEKGMGTFDEAERAEVYKELQEYLYSKTYSIPIAYRRDAYGASASITNFPFYPNIVPDLTRIEFTK